MFHHKRRITYQIGIYDNMVIRPKQEVILEALDSILAFNGVSLKLYFKTLQPLEFIDLSNAQSTDQVAEETGVEMSAEDHIEWIDGHEYIRIDSREVDYDLEDELDAELEALNSPKKTLLSKIVTLYSVTP